MTNYNNLLLMKSLNRIQKEGIIKNNPPPKPVLIEGDTYGKKDWSVLREWYQKHKNHFTQVEIAELLGYSKNYICIKLKDE